MSRAWAVGLVLVLVGCVSISPFSTASPGATGLPPSSASPTPTAPSASGQPTQIPTAPPSSGASATPSVPATPGPTIDPALAAQIDAVVAQVPALRQLEPLAPVPYEFTSRDQFRDDLIELQFEEVPEERLRAEERALKRLGLLPDDADLLQLLLDLYGGGVAAFYRPDTKRFYIIERDQPFGASDKVAVAHEYTHALQDQHFDLEANRVTDLSEGDGAFGQLGAIEGDATFTMQLWMLEHLTEAEQFELLLEAFGQLGDPLLASMPPILRRQIEYPYAEGYAFSNHLYEVGGFDAIDASLSTAIPASTEQILHPEKYLANESPVDLTLPDLTPVLGDGWQRSYEQTFGELTMQVWAAGDEAPDGFPGLPVEWPHADSVAGWGGDRLRMYENGERWLIDWHTAWDTEADAAEFSTRMIALRPTLQGHLLVEPGSDGSDNKGVHVLLANDVATMDLVQPHR